MSERDLIIDAFPHVLPMRYKDAMMKELPSSSYWVGTIPNRPALFDMEKRFRVMDKFEGMVQIITVSSPPLEMVFKPAKAAEMAKIANDGMAEMVAKYPDRFIGAVACLPMNDVDASLKEIDRTIKDLGFKGVQIHTPVVDKPMDSPEFMPIYEKMSGYNLPVWIHPYRDETYPDYRSECMSKYRIYHRFGWPYETTSAMARLVFSGVLEKYPDLKLITHHCGAMIPFMASRAAVRADMNLLPGETAPSLPKPPIEYFKRFYADTANIVTSGLNCGYDFFGAEHMLFGTDMPYGAQGGEFFIKEALEGVEKMRIPDNEKRKIFSGNIRELLRLK